MTNQNAEMDSIQPDTSTLDRRDAIACLGEERAMQDEQAEPGKDEVWFLPLFEHVQTYCGNRANPEDMCMLRFCLQHIFLCVDTLYSATLLDLTPSTSTPTKLEDILKHRRTWTQLQETKRILDRLEPLCQLFNGAVTNILASLDPLPESHTRSSTMPSEEMDTIDIANAPGTTDTHSRTFQEQWEQALIFLTSRLGEWQQCHIRHRSFSSQFIALIAEIPTLAEIDSPFDHLLENARAIFGEILLDFQAISAGDDEAVATLFLDMLQKSDQILLQIDTLMEPLHSIIKHYTLAAEMN